MTLAFLKSERAIDYLRWGGAFVTVVLVYSVAGLLLLRPTGWQRGVNSVVEIDLSDPAQLAAVPPADRETGSSVERKVPGTDVPGALPGPADQQVVAARDRADDPAKTEPGAEAQTASETSRTDATDSGGTGRPIAAPPRIVTPDNSNAASIMHAPIDTSITVNQSSRTLLRTAKGGPQFRGVQAPQLKLAPLVAASPLLATSKGRNDLFSRKLTPVAGSTIPVPTAPSSNHGYILNLARQPVMGADGRPARNAIGAIIGHGTLAPPAGAPLGIHPLPGASATHASGEHGPATTATGAPLAANALKLGAVGLPAGAADQGHAGHSDQTSPANPIATIGGSAIGGAQMIRPGSSLAAVGGSAKAVTGAISGSNVRTRHP